MLEKDVEYAFTKWLMCEPDPTYVMGRQVHLPLGILDVLAYVAGPCPAVVVAEIKAGVVNEKACTQLLGYVEQVRQIVKYATPGATSECLSDRLEVRGVLVGNSINEMTYRVVRMMSMEFVRYEVLPSGAISFAWDENYEDVIGGKPMPQPLQTISGWMSEHFEDLRARQAQNLGDSDNFASVTADRNRHNYETLARTVPYWRRKAAAK